jgi:hypothetical protein
MELSTPPGRGSRYQNGLGLASPVQVGRSRSRSERWCSNVTLGLAGEVTIRRASLGAGCCCDCVKLAGAFCIVRPCPFARGTSGQDAMNQSSSRPIIAVSSLYIGISRNIRSIETMLCGIAYWRNYRCCLQPHHATNRAKRHESRASPGLLVVGVIGFGSSCSWVLLGGLRPSA